MDIDSNHEHLYKSKAAKLWRKNAKQKVRGLHLRLVPCFGTQEAMAMDDRRQENMLLLAQKQRYFTNEYTVTIPTSHIQALDLQLTQQNNITLRRYLMSRHPPDLITQRIFVTLDKSWKSATDYVAVYPKNTLIKQGGPSTI